MSGKNKSGQKRAKKVQARKKKQQQKAKRTAEHEQELAVSEFTSAPAGLFDRRLMEREMSSALGLGRPQSADESKADDLYYAAIESTDPEECFQLLQAAIKQNPRHIDAMVELASLIDDEISMELLERAIAVGTEDLQEELRDDVGHFWGMLHTRPFMRAKQALAEHWIRRGKLAPAAHEMEEMLRLNPSDNQGMRWILMEVYCRLDRLDDAERLLAQYPDEGLPFLPLTGLLIRFRKQGDSTGLRDALRAQHNHNPHIIPRLLDPHLINHTEHPLFSPGSAEEADLYCQQFLSAWKSTPGAITWLRSAAGDLDDPPGKQAEYEDDIDIKREIQQLRVKVKKLEACPETWFCDADFISSDETEGWMLNIVVQNDDSVVCMEPGEDPLCTDTIFHGLLISMLEPEEGEPRRPTAIEFSDESLYDKLRKRLERLKIDAILIDERPEMLDFIDRTMSGALEGVDVDIDEIREMPVSNATWELDWRPIDRFVPQGPDGEVVQPCITLIVSEDNAVLAQQFSFTIPDRNTILSVLAQAVLAPNVGKPSRPALLRVPSADHQLDVKPIADDIDIDCRVGRCAVIDHAFESLEQHLEGVESGPPALISLPAVTPEIIGDLFEASAAFYASRIWTTTPPLTFIEVSCPELLPGSRYAVLMGQMGEEIGMIFFDELETLTAIFQLGPDDAGTGASEIKGLSFYFQEEPQAPPADIAAAEQFGWPVPAPEAWPMTLRVDDGEMRPPEVNELKFVTAGVRAVTAHLQAGTTELQTQVQLAAERVEVETRTVSG